MSNQPDLSRQSFLGATSDQTFASARAMIVGLGGGGSHIAQQLAHLGVGGFRLVDPQVIEASNLNRLVGATQADVMSGTAKVAIARRTILGVRPGADVRTEQDEWQKVPHFMADAHVVFGCVDGYRQREYLERSARRYGIPYIDIGMDIATIEDDQFAIGGQAIMSRPGCTCMRCMGFLTTDRLNAEEDKYGHAGATPQVVWTNGILASLAVGIFVKLFAPWFRYEAQFEWLELDGNAQTIERSVQPEFAIQGPCPHFGGEYDLGDPNFKLSGATGTDGKLTSR